MRRLLKYAFVLALAVGFGGYFVLGPFSLEDLVPLPADRNAAASPSSPLRQPRQRPSKRRLEYIVAKRVASLEGWRAFLAAHPSGAYAQSARAEVARRLGVSAATSRAAPSDNGRGYGLSERLAPVASYAQFRDGEGRAIASRREAPASGNPASLHTSSHG